MLEFMIMFIIILLAVSLPVALYVDYRDCTICMLPFVSIFMDCDRYRENCNRRLI